MMSKSANYCYAHLSDQTGLLLLCEVAAAPFYEKTGADYYADQGCKSAGARYVPGLHATITILIHPRRATKGLGRTQPKAWQDAGEALDNPALKGVHMPKGPAGDVNDRNDLYLQYNEVSSPYYMSRSVLIEVVQYIVYNSAQIRLRYLLMVKMQ